ncbi:MAG: glycosyltransferase [Thermoplasmatales archaeon]
MHPERGVSIITATFNERENVPLLLEAIDQAMTDCKHEIIVVDDNSTDGTVSILLNEMNKRNSLKVIVNKKREGLVKSNMIGLREAKGEIKVVMDADLQHPPEEIPMMLNFIEGNDAVIMSRFLPGSRIEAFDPARQFITTTAIFLCHTMIPETRSFSDPLSGFFALGEKINIPYDPVCELLDGKRAFKTLIPIIIYNTRKKIVEAPFTFRRRNWGRSKLVRDNIPIPRYIMELNAYRELTREA